MSKYKREELIGKGFTLESWIDNDIDGSQSRVEVYSIGKVEVLHGYVAESNSDEFNLIEESVTIGGEVITEEMVKALNLLF